jgi:hypothetical protein
MSAPRGLAAAVLALLPVPAALAQARGAAATAATAGAVAPPARFERVLWCSDPVTGVALAKAIGFTAIQLGRGADPAPVAAAGLGFYLDQPIGKGLLELRDDPWLTVRDAYERTRDPAVLVRPACFAAPDVLDRAVRDAAAEAARVRGDALRFVALADEPSATRHDAPLDTCRCAHCIAAYRAFLERRFRTIDAANLALGTQFPSFADAVPTTTDQVRRRELVDTTLPKDLRPFAVWLDFVDEQYANAVTAIAASVRHAVPGVPVGLTGLNPPAAFGGNDPSRWASALTLIEPYAIGGAPELLAALAPAAHRYATIAPPPREQLGKVALGPFVSARIAAMACEGLSGVVVWNDATVTAGDATTPFGLAVQQALRQWGPVLDACAGAVVDTDPVWIVESQASVRAWWMIDSARDGMTWPRRLASYEREHSTSQTARLGWLRLLQDLGLQPRFVAEVGLPERLLRERPRCVVLPASIALAERTVQAITAYARAGGVVLADHGTALYDDALLQRERGGLDELFGIEQRSLRWDDLWVREGRSTSRERGLPLAEQGLRGGVGERRDAGDAHVERAVGRGRALYLNAPVAAYPAWRLAPESVEPARELRRRVRAALVLAGAPPTCEVRGEGLPTCIARTRLVLRDGRRVLAVRVHALDAPAVLQQLAATGERPIRLELAVPATLRPLAGAPGAERLAEALAARDGGAAGGAAGRATTFELRLDPFGALLLEVMP